MTSHSNNLKEGNASSESINRLFNKLKGGQPKRFSHEDLMEYTHNLTDKIGSGGFSNVYRGQYPGGPEIAVKVLTENDVVEEVFIAEVSIIGTVSHRNLVKLYGYCFDDRTKALVYEYMEKGSLDQFLFEDKHSIGWNKFYRIAVETAKALCYLHEGCEDQIIHHDIKPSNVLLDSKLCPKVTDFGLAVLKDRDVSHITMSETRGTPGYGAPEMWMQSSHITEKCDVYSFGMMLFEILGRRSNTETLKWFPEYVWEMYVGGRMYELIEDCGIEEEDSEKAKILAMVAMWCAQFTPQRRPSMGRVVSMLEDNTQVPEPPNPFPSHDTTPNNSVKASFGPPMRPSEEVVPNAYLKNSPAIDESLHEEVASEGEEESIFSSSTVRTWFYSAGDECGHHASKSATKASQIVPNLLQFLSKNWKK